MKHRTNTTKDVKKANAHHRTTLNNVKKSNKNVEKEINLSNGKVMSGMQNGSTA